MLDRKFKKKIAKIFHRQKNEFKYDTLKVLKKHSHLVDPIRNFLAVVKILLT